VPFNRSSWSPINADGRLSAFAKWQEASKRFLDPKKDYLAEFLAAIPKVRVPKGEGETIKNAIEKAKRGAVKCVASRREAVENHR